MQAFRGTRTRRGNRERRGDQHSCRLAWRCWGLIGGPVLILSFVLKLCDVYEDGSPLAGLLTLPEAAWELSLGIYCAWKGFRPESPIARPEMAMAH